MSDATDFELTWSTPDGQPVPDNARERIARRLEAPPFSFEEIGDSWARTIEKWWDPDDDMLALSRTVGPGILFSLHYRYLGTEDDFGFTYYLDGRFQHAPAEIHVPAFDPAKLAGAPRGAP